MRIEYPPLPFAHDALAPHMSAETLELHHGKHQKTYFDKLKGLVEGTEFADQDLETIIVSTANARSGNAKKIFNNAAQLWNHAFFWHCLTPGGPKRAASLDDRLKRDFGSVEKFREAFAEQAIDLFGSGWVWLAHRKGKLEIVPTSNAGNPLSDGASRPLLVLDVWEHAYYVDHRNKRKDYVDTFLDKLANWEFAAERLQARSAKFEPAGVKA